MLNLIIKFLKEIQIMPKIRSASDIAEKWARVTPERVPDYENGVKNPKESWSEKTLAAKEAYKAGITESIAKDRFAKGVSKAGNEKWQAKAISKGVARFGPGVQVAQADYEEGFAPYAGVIAGTTLPPRFAKGDPRNIERVKAMAAAMRAKKVGA